MAQWISISPACFSLEAVLVYELVTQLFHLHF